MLSMIARTLSCHLSVRDNSPAQYSNAPQSRGPIVTLSIVSIFSPKRIVAISDIELPASMQQDSSHFDSYMDSENRVWMRRSYPSGVNLWCRFWKLWGRFWKLWGRFWKLWCTFLLQNPRLWCTFGEKTALFDTLKYITGAEKCITGEGLPGSDSDAPSK